MGEVIYLPPRLTPDSFGELKGRRPVGHPELKRDRHGRIIIEIGQVWVEAYTHMLWRVVRKVNGPEGCPSSVILHTFNEALDGFRMFTEATLPQRMTVWDEEGFSREQVMKRLTYQKEEEPEI